MKIRRFLPLLATLPLAFGCRPGPVVEEPAPTPEAALSPDAYVVDVVAEDYAFEAPDEIPSGWITFRMENVGEETHFIYLTRLGGGHTYDEYVTSVGRPIADAMARQRAGELTLEEVVGVIGEQVPAWYWADAAPMGGPGMVAPGGVAQATVRLEPGTYVMECFMKTPEGELHWVEGMIRPLTVTDEPAGAPAPSPDLRIAVRPDQYRVGGSTMPGVHTVEVVFEEHPEVGFGNDVHLVRLDDGVSGESLLPWMNFLNPHGLQNPAPATFLGGTQERPEGDVAYFTIELEPGRYAWISEGPESRQMVREFTVPQ